MVSRRYELVSDNLHSLSLMVRTRATTTPTPTPSPARKGASEPATGAVARGRAAARGRGRGRGRTSSRGRGRAPIPSDTRAVTPPPTEEVVREGEDGETEQVQNEELPPQPTLEMINQVLAYLSGLSDQGQTPQCFLHQHLRFRRYNMRLLWLPAWMPHWR